MSTFYSVLSKENTELLRFHEQINSRIIIELNYADKFSLPKIHLDSELRSS